MDFALPQIGEGVHEAELIRWLVQPGDVVRHGQPLLEVMTDKATAEVPSPFSGTIVSLKNQPGERIRVGETILSYATSSTQPVSARVDIANPVVEVTRTENTVLPATASASSNGLAAGHPTSLPPASPSVRHLARQLGVDLKSLRGSGPGGRILIEDLSTHLRSKDAARPAPVAEAPTLDVGIAGTQIKLQGLRRRIAEQMVAASRVPQYSYIDECDLSELVHLRKSLREAVSKKGIKLTYLPFVVKAVVQALQEVPLVNATLIEDSQEIHLHKHYHVGIAVATPGGLMVPVIRDADQKDLLTLASEIERLGNDARTGRLRRDDLRGGTFTVTSIGSMGGLISTPILNVPEVGILGVGKVIRRPVYDDSGRLRPADLVYLSYTFDHRIVDGALGVMFGNAINRALANPTAMLL